MTRNRRQFLEAAAAGTLSRSMAAPKERPSGPLFETDSSSLLTVYQGALKQIQSNTHPVNKYPAPVLYEGGVYGGVWLECAPLEGAVYAPFNPAVAIANHEIFFDLQKEDGYLPCYIWNDAVGTGQIQMVVPIAATAFELWQSSRDMAFLQKAYDTYAKWDSWLVKYRNTRGTGLIEAFCEYDTGHDNSPRFQGLPKKCPENDARICPKSEVLPYLAPDLSATVYGGRVAMAKMADALGRANESSEWNSKAQQIRRTMNEKLYDPKDSCFYDLTAKGEFLKIRGDALTRVLGEHVVDQSRFELIYRKQIHNSKAFWAPYPFPSIALDDPAFSQPGRNSWGGPSQALTALRAPRWMEHYGKRSDLAKLMSRWVGAIARNGGFLQQMDPRTGEFTADPGGYSPAALVLIDFVWRLHGVRPAGDGLEWNCRPIGEARYSSASLSTQSGVAKLEHDGNRAVLSVNDSRVAEVFGTCRVITDRTGHPRRLEGTAADPMNVRIVGKLHSSTHNVPPDEVVYL